MSYKHENHKCLSQIVRLSDNKLSKQAIRRQTRGYYSIFAGTLIRWNLKNIPPHNKTVKNQLESLTMKSMTNNTGTWVSNQKNDCLKSRRVRVNFWRLQEMDNRMRVMGKLPNWQTNRNWTADGKYLKHRGKKWHHKYNSRILFVINPW